MATGIMQISPARFTGKLSETLPVYVPSMPVSGSTAVWDARALRGQALNSAVESWPAQDSGPALTVEGSRFVDAVGPKLILAPDGRPAVRFEAANRNVLGASFQRPTPNTVVAVARISAYGPSLTAIVGGGPNGSALGQVMAVNETGGMRTYAGTALNLIGPKTGLDQYRVFVSVFDGEKSVARLENDEIIGNSGAYTSNVVSIGAYSNVFGSVDIKRVAYYPFAMTLAQRKTTVEGLKASFGLS